MEQDFEKKLIGSGIRPTAMRLLVLKHLEAQTHSVSLNGLEAGLNHSDRITLYRTLKTFEEKGIVHRVEDGSGSAKFALCADCETDQHHDTHIHFSCTACKETYCLHKIKIPKIELPAGFKPEDINLTVKGICDKCKD